MMNKWNIESIVIIIIIITSNALISSKSINKCPSYTVKTLSDNMLCIEQLTPSEFLMQDCPTNHKCIINESNGICELSNSYIYELGYPGSKCLNDEDCYSLKCISNKCQGSSLGEKCFSTADCSFGFICTKSFCDNPKPKNSLCEDHSQCEFPLYCYNGRCTQLFSLEDGIEIEEEHHYLCKSGKVYNSKCNQIKNINTECDEKTPCKYKDSQGNEVVIESACKCPYSQEPNAIMKCVQGDIDNPAWSNALEIIKETIEKDNVSKCNLEEKRPGFCLEQLKTNWSTRQKQVQLDTLLIEAEFNNLIPIENKYTILKTIFGIDYTPLQPKNGFKCPSYTSTLAKDVIDDKICVHAVNPFNENGDELIAYVNKNACGEGYQCNYDSSKIFREKSYNATCIEKNHWKSSYHLHLPGDKCDSNDQCQSGNYPDVGLCNDGICSGRDKEKQCKTHIDCMIGLHCSKEGICEEQQIKGAQCVDEYDCKNKYGCMNSTCIEYYSLSKGEYLDHLNPNADFCEFGIENEKTHQCAELASDLNSNSNIDLNGFIKCEFLNHQCNYTNGFEIIHQQCQCGYNHLGIAFCPLSHNENRDKWRKYYNKKKSALDNSCHTLKRRNCPNNDYTDEINHYQRLSEKAHLFYLADEDVIEVLHCLKLKWSIYLNMLLGIIVLVIF